MHQQCNLLGKEHQNQCQDDGNRQEEGDGVADENSHPLGIPFAQITSQKDHNASGHLTDDKGYHIQNAAAGGDSGNTGGGTEMTDDQHVYSTVHGLQNQCSQNGDHKLDQLSENTALGKVLPVGCICFIKTLPHDVSPLFFEV